MCLPVFAILLGLLSPLTPEGAVNAIVGLVSFALLLRRGGRWTPRLLVVVWPILWGVAMLGLFGERTCADHRTGCVPYAKVPTGATLALLLIAFVVSRWVRPAPWLALAAQTVGIAFW